MDSFVACNGRVAFVGDAAHSMVPSLGEGCNTALESAVSLAHHLSSAGSSCDTAAVTSTSVDTRRSVVGVAGSRNGLQLSSEEVSKGLRRYAAVRLPEAQEVQSKSAFAARGMTNAALADLKKKSSNGEAL
eukprot:Tamp_22217.p2 GENE.Tamp_22217~~Tamp_22217.p2  ORF type:complete len:131 (+),score=16.99 Tamp_22217:517-909(+)